MGLRNREPQPVCSFVENSGGGHWIAGYLLLGALALKRAYRLLLLAALPGLVFSLYLANIEAHILGVWCIYCVASLAVISLISLLVLGTVIVRSLRKSRTSASA